MELIVALDRLAAPGGPQTYALTVAEALAGLGHGVTLHARELGAMAGLARERGLRVAAGPDSLPERADGVLCGVDRSLAIELAGRYPSAARVFVVHGIHAVNMPPPVDGIVAATVVLNDRHAGPAAACAGAGEVVRLRQPIDMQRFGPRGEPAARPARVLLLGNYHGGSASRAELLREAWSPAGLRWEHVGYPDARLDVTFAMYGVDVVVGYGRSIVEAMASGKPAYVFDLAGADGWVTPESYERLEAVGFSGLSASPPPDRARLRDDLDAYRPELGRLGLDLARTHHDARAHAAAIVGLLGRLSPEPPPLERSALRALALLAEAQTRSELAREHNRQETRTWFARAQEANEAAAAATARAAAAERRLAELVATRRYRLAAALGRAGDALRRVSGRRR